jgi:hypothetical protein
MRVQLAMWLPARCAVCGDPYESVDDMLLRNPRATETTPDPDTGFIDDACFFDGPSPRPHYMEREVLP